MSNSAIECVSVRREFGEVAAVNGVDVFVARSTRVTVPPSTSRTEVPSGDGTRPITSSACGPSATGVAPGASDARHDWNTPPAADWYVIASMEGTKAASNSSSCAASNTSALSDVTSPFGPMVAMWIRNPNPAVEGPSDSGVWYRRVRPSADHAAPQKASSRCC